MSLLYDNISHTRTAKMRWAEYSQFLTHNVYLYDRMEFIEKIHFQTKGLHFYKYFVLYY